MATLPTIDLRTSAEREGITKDHQTAMAISNILKTIGRAEQVRQERQDLDRIATALARGMTDIEAIAAVAKQRPEFAGGITGGLQKFASAFQPSPGRIGQGIQEDVIGSRLREILSPSLLTQEEQREIKLFGQRDRTGAASVAKPTKQQTQTDKDLAALFNDNTPPFRKVGIRKRIDEDPTLQRTKKPLPTGRDFSDQLKEVEQEAEGSITGSLKEGKLFGAKAYKKLLEKLEDLGRMANLDLTNVKKELNRWWDAKVNKEQGPPGVGTKGAFTTNTLIRRSKFQEIDTPVAIPDTRLDEFWPNLPEEEKKEIIKRIEENPENINSILRILQSG